MFHALASLVIVLACVPATYFSWFDHNQKSAATLLHSLQSGDARYIWSLADPLQSNHKREPGITRLCTAGAVTLNKSCFSSRLKLPLFETNSGSADLALFLEASGVPLWRYPSLSVSLASLQSGKLFVFARIAGETKAYQSEVIRIDPGDHTYNLNLSEMIAPGNADSAIITGLRVYLQFKTKAVIGLGNVELIPAYRNNANDETESFGTLPAVIWPRTNDQLAAFRTLSRQSLNPPLIHSRSRISTPAQAEWEKKAILALSPDSPVFPGKIFAVPAAIDHSGDDRWQWLVFIGLMALATMLLVSRRGGRSILAVVAMLVAAAIFLSFNLDASEWPGWPAAIALSAFSILIVVMAITGHSNSRAVAVKNPEKSTLIWWLSAATILVILALSMTYGIRPDANTASLLKYALFYPVWATLQQLILGPVIAGNLVGILRRDVAIQFAALSFAIVHFPNAGLMLGTYLLGLVWSNHYLRTTKLLPQIVSHTVIGTAALGLLPEWILWSGSVGIRFLQ